MGKVLCSQGIQGIILLSSTSTTIFCNGALWGPGAFFWVTTYSIGCAGPLSAPMRQEFTAVIQLWIHLKPRTSHLGPGASNPLAQLSWR